MTDGLQSLGSAATSPHRLAEIRNARFEIRSDADGRFTTVKSWLLGRRRLNRGWRRGRGPPPYKNKLNVHEQVERRTAFLEMFQSFGLGQEIGNTLVLRYLFLSVFASLGWTRHRRAVRFEDRRRRKDRSDARKLLRSCWICSEPERIPELSVVMIEK